MQLDPGSGAVAMVLREHDPPGRVVPIVIGGIEAVSIASAVNGDEPSRPTSHDLMASLLAATGARLEAIEVTELREGAFVAELAVSGPGGDAHVDSRPSDAVALALRVEAPMFVAETLLDEVGFVIPDLPDEEQIEEELEEFRARLDEVGVDTFVDEDSHDGPGDPPPPG